jgi:UDP-N-acetylglucosamine 2-epimerase (non-hydrolysing)
MMPEDEEKHLYGNLVEEDEIQLGKTKVTLVLGTRPQIIKSAPLIHHAVTDRQIEFSIIHTGQHYDYEMTKIFFEELSLPDPTVNLEVGSGSHAQQTANIMLRLERILLERKPDVVVVPGDTNSTLAGAITAAKLNIPVAHMEAGARSYDMKMPEEINRRLTDHCSTMLFTPTKNCTKNLLKEGIDKHRICQAGDTMYDVLLLQLPKAERIATLKQLGLKPKTYALLTTHRPENVDNAQNLENIVNAVMGLKNLMVVFAVHPRTRKQLRNIKLYHKLEGQSNIRLIEPQGYLETLSLIKNAAVVLTDSGGMQKEAFWLKTPCVTLRENTEWTETCEFGANYLIGPNTERILETVEKIIQDKNLGKKLKRLPNPFGDGKASQRIVEAIKNN